MGARMLRRRSAGRDGRNDQIRTARGLGTPAFDLQGRRGELLALTYFLGAAAVVIAWLVDPGIVGNALGLGILLGVVFGTAVAMHLFRDRLPSWTGDAAIVGSLVLIDFGMFCTRLHAYPLLLSPFYVWVGFASPLWFPRRRAALYVLLAIAASGLVVGVAGTAAAVAGWIITVATIVVAFFITNFLSKALVQRERLAVVGEMASVVGHDLRNPLGAMSNTLFLLRHDLGAQLTVERDRYLTTAEREIAKATSIIGHLSSFVRTAQPVLDTVDVEALMAEILEVAPPPPAVDVSVNASGVRLVADKAQIAEALTNLVTNAYDAVGAGGTVKLVASSEKGWVYLVVEDDGPGIDRSLADKIFEPFFTTKHRGTGLGLAIVRKLAEAHGGSVRVESPASEGTRFVLRLPSVPTRSPGPSTRSSKPETTGRASTKDSGKDLDKNQPTAKGGGVALPPTKKEAADTSKGAQPTLRQ